MSDEYLDIETDSIDNSQLESEQIEEKIHEEAIQQTIKMDYSLKTAAERTALVERIIAATPQQQLTPRYLEILGDYIMGGITKEERKSKLYLTDNRLITINKRETSFEGLAEKFENGEDGLYNIMTNDKNILFTQKHAITEDDIETIPGLKELRQAMEEVEAQGKAATGRRKFLLKKQLIEMRRDQYVLKSMFKPQIQLTTSPRGINKIDLTERRWVDENMEPQSEGLITFFNPKHIAAILTYYNALKADVAGRYSDDFFYLMEDFDKLLKRSLKNYPMLDLIVKYKFDGKSGLEIQAAIEKEFGIKHTVEYISSLWRNKIPKIISEQEKNDYLLWYFTNEKEGKWKKCSCCGQTKLAHNRFFSKNNTSKDGFYSQCKECRNAKTIKVKKVIK